HRYTIPFCFFGANQARYVHIKNKGIEKQPQKYGYFSIPYCRIAGREAISVGQQVDHNLREHLRRCKAQWVSFPHAQLFFSMATYSPG
ncbi:MAG: hypothetical protein ACERKO_09825, partial [Acetanaerobacterium sp.]